MSYGYNDYIAQQTAAAKSAAPAAPAPQAPAPNQVQRRPGISVQDYLAHLRTLNPAKSAAQTSRETDVANQKNALINQYGDSARRGLANSLAQTQRDANKRGLLYSGQHEGARADLRSQAAGDMASYRTQVNQAADDQLGALTEQSARRGLQSYETDINKNVSEYQDALKRYKNRQGAFGALGDAAMAVGTLLPF